MEGMERPERYRHLSESSLDVQHGDSNISMMNDNSMDLMGHGMMSDNSNMHSDNSMDHVMAARRTSMGRRICESSMDVNSQMSSINEDSSCSSVMHCGNAGLLQITSPPTTADELKVMDLRMKMPMATVADLGCSTAPSMATLRSFGVTEAACGPLPAQSAQSIEQFLTSNKLTTDFVVSLVQWLH